MKKIITTEKIIKIFISLFSLCVIVTALLSLSTFSSTLQPNVIVEKIYNYNSILSNITVIGGIILMIASIYYYFITDISKYIWLSIVVFTISVLVEMYLIDKIFAFKKNNGLWQGEFSISIFYAAFKIGVACIFGFIAWSIKKFHRFVMK